jgi:hypothetical protein
MIEIVSTDVPATMCAACGERLDGATSTFHPGLPSEGDVSVCAYCHNIAVYRADQTLRPMTAREWAALPAYVRRELEAIKAHIGITRP